MDLKMEVYTPGLELIGFLEIQKSVIWEEKAFSVGSFSLESLITPESLALLQPENIIWIEGETAGIIEYVQEEAGQDGPYITVKGSTLIGILGRRILWGLYSLKGTPPAIMHALVDDCCIHPTRGNVEARRIPGLVLLDAPVGGNAVQIQKTGGTLLEALEQIGETYGVAFGIRFNPAVPQMEFWTRWGQNRSIHQTINEPVFYSTELDDVLSSEYFYNSQNYRNVTLVAGEGEGKDRVYVTVEDEPQESPDVPVPPEPPIEEKNTVTLLVDPAGGGVASGGKTVVAGTSVTVAAAPSDGYGFVGWSENGGIVSTSAAYTFVVTADRTLTAVFAAITPAYTITVSIDPAGSGTVTGAGQYQEGETVTLKVAMADGYTFTGWQENGQTVSTSETYTFTAAGDRMLVAVCEAKVSRLPVGYTEVEYIQTKSGSLHRFDTDITQSNLRSINMDFEPAEAGGSAKWIFDSYYRSTTSTAYTYIISAAWTTGGVKAKAGQTTAVSPTLTVVNSNTTQRRMTLELQRTSGATASIDGGTAINVSTGTSSYNASQKIYLCGRYGASASSSMLSMKLYSCQISGASGLLRDFVPCTNSSGVAGLYDLVGKKFYQSISNPSTVTAGPAV